MKTEKLTALPTAAAAGRAITKNPAMNATAAGALARRFFAAHGWPWPKKWTGAGRRSEYYGIGKPIHKKAPILKRVEEKDDGNL